MSMDFKKEALQKFALSYELARTATFLGQNLSLPIFEYFVTGQSKALRKEFPENLQHILRDLYGLLETDSKNIAEGFYPIEVLKPESLRRSLLRYPKIIFDGISIAQRRKQKKAHEFQAEAEQYFEDVPDYFKRNFHFQTGGYLTEQSAELYEHQVEILFSGAADAMRRLILPLMKKRNFSDGEGLHFLEVAAGTGRLTRFVKMAFPKARITLLDLSHPYLKKAQERLKDFSRLDFIQGDGAHLPFPDQKFDAVYSCFLFHELPMDERKKVLKEGLRVLQDEGFYGLVDSVQEQEKENFAWALQQFPVDFHEPFYKNYTQNPMEVLLKEAGFVSIETKLGFFSKAIGAVKPKAV